MKIRLSNRFSNTSENKTETTFRFKHFSLRQENAAFRLTTDAILLGALAPLENSKNILDIGCGTGILSLMAAQRSEGCITAIEKDSGSAAEARINFSESRWKAKITLIEGNACELKTKGEFDFIICNPPFFQDSLLGPNARKNAARHIDTLTPDVLLGLFSEQKAENKQLCTIAPLKYHGQIQSKAENLGYCAISEIHIKDHFQKPPNRSILTIGGNSFQHEKKVIEFCIRDEKGNYSEEYKNLVKDFLIKKL